MSINHSNTIEFVAFNVGDITERLQNLCPVGIWANHITISEATTDSERTVYSWNWTSLAEQSFVQTLLMNAVLQMATPSASLPSPMDDRTQTKSTKIMQNIN